ncbi:radical SAM/SPASM domain-containing protein [Paenibacillus sp. HW567]|uniref:radical SAM/SPASM domain-containing protein n=1 Tax=Paenibacillus sp. HW567 TaxID=1034769 RepID=UPI00036075E1|nr:radical SAM protein [Paenibacillus sp. HW567]
MKASNYNFFYDFPEEGKTLAYNSRTAALALMEKDKYDSYQKFQNENDITYLDAELIKQLKLGGFILDRDLSEIDIMKSRLLRNRYSTRQLGLTIATTLNCNLGCIYCYEKDFRNNKKMSQEVLDKIVELVMNQAKGLDSLSVCWYGGEPLLDMNVIRFLSNKFMQICEENKIEYSASIITNGYRLDRSLAEELRGFKVFMAQVTIDGPKEIHDIRRPLVGGQPTFDKILDNIKETSDVLNISLRINTDTTNKDELDDLLQLIKNSDLKEKIHIYLGHVKNSNDCYSKNSCMTTKSFTELSYEFDEKVHNNGFHSGFYSFPNLTGPYCTADSMNSMVLDPEGYIYNCWTEVGNVKDSYGSIVDESFEGNINLRLEYLLFEPFNNDKCSSCKILPVCMGGCPNSRVSGEDDRCSEYKYNLQKKLEDYATFLIKQSSMKEEHSII